MADVSAGAQRAISAAMSLLERYSGESQVAALLSKLEAVAVGDKATGVEKAMVDMDTLLKADHTDPITRARVEKTHRELDLEYLHRHNPRAAENWERARGLRD